MIHVAVGVIKKNNGHQICIAKRPDKIHQGGLWEFPGGKVEQGETVEQALVRELQEELGISVLSSNKFMDIQFDYGDKKVWLDIHIVEEFRGDPVGREGQPIKWVNINDLKKYPFPAANVAIIEKLQLNSID